MKDNIAQRVKEIGIIPVVNIKDPAKAVPLSQALIEGGIPVIEVTFRSDAAAESIQRIHDAFPEMIIGAGTVLKTSQVDAAIAAGADFIVAPGLNPTTVKYCQEKGIAIFPGAVTASEIELGLSLGLSTFKFFPTDIAGGLSAMKAFKGPFGSIEFIPTGGINLGNLDQYVSSPMIAAVGGSFVASSALIDACDWAGITALAKEAVRISLGFSLAHIGINHASEEEANKTAQRFAALFGLPIKAGGNSSFVGSMVETMNEQYYGTKGHIAISTYSLARATAYLKRQGVELRDPQPNAQGKLTVVYLKEEIGGFAVHLTQK